MIKKFKKKGKQVKDLVPNTDAVVQRVANMNPLTERRDEAPLAEDVPRITNETITEHREEVLSGARKYIYPLQHSKHRIVLITTTIILLAAAVFLIYCGLALYRFYQYNTFLYRITQVVPFPIARVGDKFVEYENYLFELRHYVHYYQNQLQSSFEGQEKEQLEQYKKQALTDVINQAYVKDLAKQNKVGVSNKEVNDRINVVREQNRLGSNNKVLNDVLRDYWGWSLADFKRSLKQQMLADKLVAKLDTVTHQRAESVLVQARAGADFTALAKAASDDPNAKNNGGDFGTPINKSNPNIPPQITEALFKLKPGEISAIINAGSTLEILKVNQNDGVSVTGQHISFNLKDISEFIEPLKKKEQPRIYIKL